MKKLVILFFIVIITSGCPLSYIVRDTSAETRSNEPFEYFTRPFTAIGVLGGPESTMITPEGFVCTDFATLKFYTSESHNPVQQKLKTLKRGYLPVLEMGCSDVIDYNFTFFAAHRTGLSEVDYAVSNIRTKAQNILNFIEIIVKNTTDTTQEYSLFIGIDFGINVRQLRKLKEILHATGAIDSTAEMMVEELFFDKNKQVLRNDNTVILYSSPVPFKVIGWRNKCEFLIQFCEKLKPGQETKIILKIPYWPAKISDIPPLTKADFNYHLRNTISFWEQLFANHLVIDIDEKKVSDVFKASLMYILTSSLKIVENSEGKHFIVHANPFQYDRFWVRDGVKIIRALDYAGFHDIAENCLRYLYKNYQQPDGSYASQRGQLDGVGQGLWGIGQHHQLTRDKGWAYEIFPSISHDIDWLINNRRNNDGLIQQSSARDNEQVENGHYVGHNLWALMGLRSVLPIAETISSDISKKWQIEYEDYHKSFLTALDELTRRTGGLITPSFEGFDGQCPHFGAYGNILGIDWGNLMVAYPSGALPPDDRRLDKSMKIWRSLYREGLLTYPIHMDFSSIHDYNTEWVTGTSLIRNEQKDVLTDLYSGFLLHTTATNAGCEGIDALLADFSYDTNITPHCQYAARYIWLLREMLVREEDDIIHLLSCLSPEWIKPESVLKVGNVATNFGPMGIEVKAEKNSIKIMIEPPSRNPFSHFRLHIPYWITCSKEVIINGKKREVSDTTFLSLKPDETDIELQIVSVRDTGLSYNNAVQEYKESRKKFHTALNDTKILMCPTTTKTIEIDGELSGEWETSVWFEDFISADGKASQPRQKTSASIVCNDSALYVAFECEDGEITRGFPAVWTHDYVGIAIEKDRDSNLFYVLAIDVNNELEILEVERRSYGWGGITTKKGIIKGVRSAIKLYDKKYVVELSMPLPKKNRRLLFNLIRNDATSFNPFSHYTWKFTGYNFLAFEHFAKLNLAVK